MKKNVNQVWGYLIKVSLIEPIYLAAFLNFIIDKDSF